MSDSCLFCAIAAGTIPAVIVRRSDRVVVFRDVAPQAPVHILAIPVEHHRNLEVLSAADPTLVSELVAESTAAAAAEGLADGYRVVFNTGQNGGQTVDHVHAHVLGGRRLNWPPG
ncbi:MAG: HIT domain-containing protein [Actinomycetes bacterium]